MIDFFPQATLSHPAEILSWIDFIIAPIFVFFIYKICYNVYEKKYKKESYGKYFLLGIQIKLASNILYWAVNEFYYKGGDTFVYFWHIIKLKQLLFEDPTLVFNILFNNMDFHTRLYLQQ